VFKLAAELRDIGYLVGFYFGFGTGGGCVVVVFILFVL
jgi:hypothetical protein